MEIEGPFDYLWIPSSSDSLQGCSSMFKFDNSSAEMKPLIAQLVNDDNDLDRSLNQQEKKRRLSVDKVRFLERNFDVENKLGPDRKIQLAKELGLQPRQIAIWFQNRRARYKTKQLEKDYDSLKASYDELKDNCDHLFKENEDLKNQIDLLKEKLQEKQKSKPCDLLIELDKKQIVGSNSRSTENVKTILGSKQEDVNSIKSDVIDSESIESCHVNTISNNSLLLEPANSSHAFELDQPGDFSQDEEDNFSKSLMILPSLPKLEDSWIISCYNYPVEDQSFWSWPY